MGGFGHVSKDSLAMRESSGQDQTLGYGSQSRNDVTGPASTDSLKTLTQAHL